MPVSSIVAAVQRIAPSFRGPELDPFGVGATSDCNRYASVKVWVPALSDREDMEGVVQKAFRFGSSSADIKTATGSGDVSQMAGPMLDFAWWFNNTVRRMVAALLVALLEAIEPVFFLSSRGNSLRVFVFRAPLEYALSALVLTFILCCMERSLLL